MRICIVGAGFSGAVIARQLADAGFRSVVIDERTHTAGNCHTHRDARTGIMLHAYGPHIFHTGNREVWDYVSRFGELVPYVHRPKANVNGRVFSLPVNLHTINQFFDKAFSPAEARDYVSSLAHHGIEEPRNFEEQALKMVGEALYRAFFFGYTRKQWGVEPDQLPSSILKRLPLRFTYEDNYFSHPYQGLPRGGYTEMVNGMLASGRIDLRLNCAFEDLDERFDHVVYTGPIDRYFDHAHGRLGYRTLDFERIDQAGDYQGTAIMNYCDFEVPYTRVTEHKHFAPWEAGDHAHTVCFREFSRACTADDIPFYPIRLVNEKVMLADYVERAKREKHVTFVGRLGTYSYLDMDVAIARALETAESLIAAFRQSTVPPVFVHAPL